MKKERKTTDEKIHFYYKRDRNNRPLITVCLIHGERGVGRGIAICSPNDNPVKKIGREYAKRRALKAYWEKQIGEHVESTKPRTSLFNTDIEVYGEPKIWFDPILTKHEKRIIAKANGTML